MKTIALLALIGISAVAGYIVRPDPAGASQDACDSLLRASITDVRVYERGTMALEDGGYQIVYGIEMPSGRKLVVHCQTNQHDIVVHLWNIQ